MNTLKILTLLAAVLLSVIACDANESGSGSNLPVINSDDSVNESLTENVVTAVNRLVYNDTARTLDTGIVDVINDARGHLEVDFNISDGEYQLSFYQANGFLYSYWFGMNETVSFNVDLYSPSTAELMPGTYHYVDISDIRDGDSTLGQAVFSQASVGWDFNGNGYVDDDEELDIVAGTVLLNINGNSDQSLETATLSWNVLLVDGNRSTGSYSGGFELVD